jgi:hypothetical protein
MVDAHHIARISEVFGRNPALLEWVLRDPVARASGLLVNLSEFQREFLYRYCVLGLDKGEIEDWLVQCKPGSGLAQELETVTADLVVTAPSLLDVFRARKQESARRKA